MIGVFETYSMTYNTGCVTRQYFENKNGNESIQQSNRLFPSRDRSCASVERANGVGLHHVKDVNDKGIQPPRPDYILP